MVDTPAAGSFAVDEETDLAFLDQHLLKTNGLTKRMTTILSQLDSRLSRLDKTIQPLGIREKATFQSNVDAMLDILDPGGARPTVKRQESHGGSNGHGSPSLSARSPLMTRTEVDGSSPVARNPPQRHVSIMDRTRAIDRRDKLPRWAEDAAARQSHVSTAGARSPAPTIATDVTSLRQEASPIATTPVGTEKAILARGIDPMAPGEFFGAMQNVIEDIERMDRGIAEGRGGSREAGINELSSILQTSFGQAVQLFIKTVKDTLPAPFDPGRYASSSPPLQTYYPPYNNLRQLSVPIAALAWPDEPTPRSARVLMPMVNDCFADAAAIRGEWLRQSFIGLSGRVEDADGALYDGRGGEKVRLCMKMWDTFLTVAESEAGLGSTLMPGQAGLDLAIQTLASPLKLVNGTMNAVVTSIKRAMSAQTMTMLDLYASLNEFQPRYEEVVGSTFQGQAHDLQNALSQPLSLLKGMALRSFPERLIDIRTPLPKGGPHTMSTAVSDTTHNTLAYLEALPSFGSLVDTLLRSGGKAERAWLMGAAPPSTAKSAGSEGGLLNLYAADVLGTLLQFLESQAKNTPRPVGATTYVNNVSHIRNMISSFKDDIIGPGAEDMLNRSFREAKAMFVAEWKPLVQCLQHQAQSRFGVPGTSHDKQSTKEASAAFFDRLNELEMTTRQFPLSRQDPELRERLGREVEDLVKNAYTPFWQKGNAKGYDKYLRATPDEVSRRIRALFR